MNKSQGMRAGLGLLVVAGFLAFGGIAAAQGQTQPWPPEPAGNQPVGPGAGQAVQPDQPVMPQYPTIERRTPPQGPIQGPPDNRSYPPGPYPANMVGGQARDRIVGPPQNPQAQAPAPFVLSPQEQAQVDAVLADWERRNKEVKSFDCDVACFFYDGVFGDGRQAKQERGFLKYSAPDKGLFELEGERPEKWVCDGASIFEYRPSDKTVREYRLPPELRGKAISDGPLPFVFGTEAQKIKQRYALRMITPRDVQGEVWLAAFPRTQQQAADFSKIEVIIKTESMLPYAVQVFSPNGKDRKVYQFNNVTVNSPLRFLRGNPFHAAVPYGWKTIVEEPPTANVQANRGPGAGVR